MTRAAGSSAGGVLVRAALVGAALSGLLAVPAAAQHGGGADPHHHVDEGFAHGGRPGAKPPPAPTVDLAKAPRVRWGNPQGGRWGDPANWSGGALPGVGDVAVLDLPGAYTVTLDTDARIAGLTLGGDGASPTLVVPAFGIALGALGSIEPGAVLHLAGGNLTGPGDLEVRGTLRWTGGALSGRGAARVDRTGRIEISGSDRKYLSLRRLESSGAIRWEGTGNLVLTFDARIDVRAGGSLTLASDALLDVYGPPGPKLVNAGLLEKVSSGVSELETPLENDGTLDLHDGTLRLLAGLREGAQAVLALDLGPAGKPPRLDVQGTAELGGRLELRWPMGAGELPAKGLTALVFQARSGDFTRVEGPAVSGGRALAPRFGPHALTLGEAPSQPAPEASGSRP